MIIGICSNVRAFDIAHVLASALACLFPLLVIQTARDLETAWIIALCTLGAGAGAAIAGLICRWWPGLAAPAWRLWLAAWLFNPVVILGLGYLLFEYECLFGQVRGWKCIGMALVVLASPATLVGPTIAVIVHVVARRMRAAAG